jgi:uncharacterized RDD family membrane protein YckC
MRCSACGARYDNPSARCPECGALQNATSVNLSAQAQPDQQRITEETAPPKTTQKRRPAARRTPSLIEFPGVNRSAMPQWRKELGERVREVQERRAREAILEAAEIGPLFSEAEPKAAPMLELLPQAETPQMNPLVVAALRRIERARSQARGNAAAATAVAYEEQPMEQPRAVADPTIDEAVSKPERVHNLAVVPTPEVIAAEVAPEIIPQEVSPKEVRKPRRVIDDQNDPALNYLDSIPRSVMIESRDYLSAPLFRRMLSALVDLIVVGLLSSPFLALTELTNLDWQSPRVIAFVVGSFFVLGFLYLTVSVAFTGRTIGMKLLSLRVVDARTGLIPTGSQSAGRSLVYMLTLASAGIALMYAFIDTEKHTVHDLFTRTAVIRA